MKWNKSKIIIVILSVLLAIVSCALVLTVIKLNDAYAQGSSTVPDNKIEQQKKVEASLYYAEPAPMVMSLAYKSSSPSAGIQLLSASDSEKIKLSGDDQKSATPIQIKDMYPGDSFTKKYVVTVNDDLATVVLFSADFFDNTVSPTDAQKNRDRSLMKMVVKANGTEIYNGKLDSVESAIFTLNGAEKVTYEITVSLDTSAGNEYANLKLGVTFHWMLGNEQIYKVVYTDGVNGVAFPTQEYPVTLTDIVPGFDGTPTREGYKFIGWDEKIDETTSSLVYTAKWEKLYTVTYTDGSTKEQFFKDQVSKNLEKGSETPSFEGTPSRSGYEFTGWYPAVTDTVENDVVYTAQWKSVTPPEPAKYSVTYTDGVDNEEIFKDVVFDNLAYGANTPSFGDDPVRSGYIFKGWNPKVSEKVTGNVTYTAIWELIPTYTVRYTDGVDDEVIFEDEVTSGLYAGDPTPAFKGNLTRSGYTFKGWNPEVAATVTGDVTYTAQWEANNPPEPTYYTIIYSDGADGKVFDDKVFDKKQIGDDTPSFGEDPTREGYIFKGWNPEVAATVTGDVTYTAQWELIPTYTVRYTDGADDEVIFEDQVTSGLYAGDPTPAFKGNLTRSGYTFKGWNPEVSEKVTENVTYTATWELIPTYTVRYTDGVDDEVIFDDEIFANIPEGSDTPAFTGDLKREGYTFAGWYPELSDKVFANVTYVAQWRENKIPQEQELIIDEDNHSVSAEIRIDNPQGGDSWEHKYKIIVNEDGFNGLYVDWSVIEDPGKLADVLNITIICDETGDVLYSGLLKDMPQSLKSTISGKYGEVCHYTVTASLDEKYASSYSDYDVDLRLQWAIKGKSCHCILCAVVRWFGGPDCICPWCWIILILLICLIIHIIYELLKRRKDKEKKDDQPAVADIPVVADAAVPTATEKEEHKKKKKQHLTSKSDSSRAKRRHKRKR